MSLDSAGSLSPDSKSQDIYSYNPDNMFSEGWKFDYKTQGPTGEVETQSCKVVEVLPSGKREVRWEDSTIDPLHVNDI